MTSTAAVLRDPSAHLVATRCLVDGDGESLTLYQNIGGDPADRSELTRAD